MAELIAAGSTATAWVDFTVTQGSPRSLFMKSASGDSPAPAKVDFELAHKTSDNRYCRIATLHAGNISELGTVDAAGTFGLRRLASEYSAGMDIEGT